eukprot:s512_g24.t1
MARKRPAAIAELAGTYLWQFKMECADLRTIDWSSCPDSDWVESELAQKLLLSNLGKPLSFQPFDDEMKAYIDAKFPCSGLGFVRWVVTERVPGVQAKVTLWNRKRNMWLHLRRARARCFASAAMEVKGIVGSVDAKGMVRLSCDGQTVSKEDRTLKQLYADSAETKSAATAMDASAPASGSLAEATETSWLEPWRGKADAAAKDTIEEIEDRGDIDLDNCPILEELKTLRIRLRTAPELDQNNVYDVIEGGRMLTNVCAVCLSLGMLLPCDCIRYYCF